jgi:hypothetical protein
MVLLKEVGTHRTICFREDRKEAVPGPGHREANFTFDTNGKFICSGMLLSSKDKPSLEDWEFLWEVTKELESMKRKQP